MENKYIILICIIVEMFCGINNSKKISLDDQTTIGIPQKKEISKFIPDIKLDRFSLMEKLISFENKKVINDFLFCINKNGSEYLAMAVSYGDMKNTYRLFRVFKREHIRSYEEFKNINIENIDIKKLKIDNFISESGIRIGIDKSELIKKKGSDYVIEEYSDKSKITYKISNYKESDFLKKYNMPVYKSEYLFDLNNKLIQFNFGFVIP